MKQRLCLARCLMHNPKLLILDEPASGMDPRARFEMKNILKNLREMDETIIVSSHILSELGEICTNIGIIERGKMVCQGTVEEIMEEAKGNNPLFITVIDGVEEAIKVLKEIPTIGKVTFDKNKITASLSGNEAEAAEVFRTLINRNIKVTSFNKSEGNLEDLFIKLTENVES